MSPFLGVSGEYDANAVVRHHAVLTVCQEPGASAFQARPLTTATNNLTPIRHTLRISTKIFRLPALATRWLWATSSAV